MNDKIKDSPLFQLIISILIIILVFFVLAGLVWVVCWAFNLTFSWKLCIGIIALLFLIGLFLG